MRLAARPPQPWRQQAAAAARCQQQASQLGRRALLLVRQQCSPRGVLRKRRQQLAP